MAEHQQPLGRVLVLANPAAQSGRGAQGARLVERALEKGALQVDDYEVRLTAGPGDAAAIAEAASPFDTVAVIGGDGVIHEAVQGLMRVPGPGRPRLAVVPLGSGNDYARTIGMPRNDPEAALAAIGHARTQRLDLGLVNGTYFMQTLSFGLDAAIALGSMERRRKNGAHGTRLFAAESLEVFGRSRDAWDYRATLECPGPDGTVQKRAMSGREIVFAVQVGPTYGGGFRICPDASPTDGLLDLCRSVMLPSVPRVLGLLALARFGRHTGSKVVSFDRLTRMELEFDREPPCQADGEKLTGTAFRIESVPAALEVAVCDR